MKESDLVILFWTILGLNIFLLTVYYFVGRYSTKGPEMNPFLGYRTSRSMMNEDTWKFAQELSGRLLLKSIPWIALLAVPVTICCYIWRTELISAYLESGLLLIIIGLLFYIIFKVEVALMATFDDEGKRKVSESSKDSSDPGSVD